MNTAAATLGAKGGKAGSGKAKRRGGASHYSTMASSRQHAGIVPKGHVRVTHPKTKRRYQLPRPDGGQYLAIVGRLNRKGGKGAHPCDAMPAAARTGRHDRCAAWADGPCSLWVAAGLRD